MQPRKAVIVNQARLAGELIKRVIERDSIFQIAREIEDLKGLSSAVVDTRVDWVFVILTSQDEIPESLKAELFLTHPTLRLIALWVDDSRIRMERLVREQKDLTGFTLEELIILLQNEAREQAKALSGDITGE